MTHDPLCPYVQTAHQRDHVACQCDLIAKVREDERNARTTAWDDGMEVGTFSAIEACIAAVDGLDKYHHGQIDASEALAALRALQEKP